MEELEQRRAQWEALEKQEALRQWRAAQEDLTRRRQQLTALQQLDGNLPDRDTLARMQAQLELLEQAGGTLTQARRIAQQRQTEAQEAQEAWSAHPLYPNDENQLRQQAEAMTAPAGPRKALPIAAVVLLCAAAAALALLPAPAKLIAAAIGAAAAVGLFLYYMVSRRRPSMPPRRCRPGRRRCSGRQRSICVCGKTPGRRRTPPERPRPLPRVSPSSCRGNW